MYTGDNECVVPPETGASIISAPAWSILTETSRATCTSRVVESMKILGPSESSDVLVDVGEEEWRA